MSERPGGAASDSARSPGAAPAPHEPAPGGPPDAEVLAGRWLVALERLTARAAHEVANALNGAVMNLEVVRLKARSGADAGAVAPFAEVAAGELERATALVGALVALARAPGGAGGPTDLAPALGHAVALLGPVLAHRGASLVVEPAAAAVRTALSPHAVRYAIVSALLALDEAGGRGVAAAGAAAESGGPEHADELPRAWRCTLRADPAPELRIAGAAFDLPRAWLGAGPRDALARSLATAEVGVGLAEDGALTLRFPPAA